MYVRPHYPFTHLMVQYLSLYIPRSPNPINLSNAILISPCSASHIHIHLPFFLYMRTKLCFRFSLMKKSFTYLSKGLRLCTFSMLLDKLFNLGTVTHTNELIDDLTIMESSHCRQSSNLDPILRSCIYNNHDSFFTLYLAANSVASSTLSLTRVTLGLAATVFSSKGPSILQGPHHLM